MRQWWYEDAERPWEPDAVVRKYEKQVLRFASLKIAPFDKAQGKRDRQDDRRLRSAQALDLGMGYGRNALWLAEQGFEVEGWELEGRYVREARERARHLGLLRGTANKGPGEQQVPRPEGIGASLDFARDKRDDSSGTHGRPGRVKFRRGDFVRGDWRGPYDAIVISQALHQLKRSEALRVLCRAKKALAPRGRLFLLAKLTRDKHVRRVAASEEWERVRGERNTWRRVAPRGQREFHAGRRRRRWTLLSALTRGEIRGALRGLRLVHYQEVVLRSDWCAQGASHTGRTAASGGEESKVVTHTVAEVVAVKT